MSFPRYDSYRVVREPALDELPGHWITTKIKHLGWIQYGIGEPPAYRENGVPLIRATDVHAGRIMSDGCVRVNPNDVPSERIVWLSPGDIIVVRSGAYTGDSAIVPSGFGKAIAGFDMVLRCERAHAPFVQYALLSRYLKESQIDLHRVRAAQPHLNAEQLGSCWIALPPHHEQLVICGVLDQQCERIDTLIEEQRRLIELLNEKRQAVISHAVTKGQNPDAPMKPSGVEWLGEVPTHWQVGAIRYYARFRTGGTPDRQTDRFWLGSIPWVKTGEINYARITSTEETISQEGLDSCSASVLPAGTLLMALYGQGATRGRVALLEIDAACNQACAAIESDGRLDQGYLRWLFDFAYQFVRDTGNETTQMNLSLDFVRRIRVCIPPLREQLEIADQVQRQTVAIDSLVEQATTAISLLHERRVALISAAVTGQIDVRGLAAVEVA